MKKCKSLGLLIGFYLISINAKSILKRPGKVIIDTDAGGDDASAMLLALVAEEELQDSDLEILAITCSYGNTNITNVGLNVLKILTIGNRSDIPVYIGAHRPLMKNYTKAKHYGEDGLGDFDFGEEIIGTIDRSKHASLALVDLAKQNPGKVSILALGPLTNIALAMTLDQTFVQNVERFYIMGSTIHGFGNIAPNVEFNFFQDPESDFIVLNSTTTPPAILLPWETPFRASIPIEWRKDILGALDSRIIHFLNRVEKNNNFGDSIWISADVTLVALALWPELIEETIVVNVTPVFDGTAEGSVLVDYRNKTGKQPNAEILENFFVAGFQQVLLKSFA